MKPLDQCQLYSFVDAAYLSGRSPELITEQLCEGGSDLIQLRAKNLTQDEVRRMADCILPITERANIGLVVNDHPGIALSVGAQFCHLGQEDFFGSGYSHRSNLVPPDRSLMIGLSTHAPEQAIGAVNAGADYVAIGPIYRTETKPLAEPVTLNYVRWAARTLRIPWFAIGGINLTNLDDVLLAGARRICVVSAILNSRHVAHACRKFKDRLMSAPFEKQIASPNGPGISLT